MSDPLLAMKYVTVEELATALRVANMTVYRMVHSGELPAIKVGRQYRIPEQAAVDFIKAKLDAAQDR